MSPDGEPAEVQITWLGGLRVAVRLPVVLILVFGGLALHLSIRLFERPLCGQNRPVTPFVTQGVCKAVLWMMGLRISVDGTPMRERGAVVSNHVGWIDIFLLNAPQRIYFVAKSEVAGWPAIGWLARATGTVFIKRDPRDAKRQQGIFESRLSAGHHLCFFPEGTNSDSLRLLPFKPTLFQAFFAPELRETMHIQPVTLVCHAPQGQDPRFFGWWGSLSLIRHVFQVLAQPRGKRGAHIEIVFHTPVAVADFANRKELSRYCRAEIGATLKSRLPEGVYIEDSA